MSKKINTKWVNDNAITGAKIRLANDEVFKARNVGDDGDVSILKVSGNDKVITLDFFQTPSTAPTTSYDTANKKYVDDVILSTDVADLNDVTISGASSGQALVWDGSKWINSSVGSSSGGATALSDLTDVIISSETNGQVLKYDGANWVNATVSGVGEANFGSTYSFHLPAKATISERCLSATGVPSGWVLMAGIADQAKIHRLGSSASDFIISHDVGQFVYDVRIIEHDYTGPLNTQYANFVDLTAQNVIRNNVSDVGSGISGVTGAFKVQDLAGKLQTGNDAIVICSFLKS